MRGSLARSRATSSAWRSLLVLSTACSTWFGSTSSLEAAPRTVSTAARASSAAKPAAAKPAPEAPKATPATAKQSVTESAPSPEPVGAPDETGQSPNQDSAGSQPQESQPVVPDPAAAEDEEARSLFLEGRRLLDLGSYQDACFSFEQSLRLKERVTTKFHLAECYAKRERNASALKLYNQVTKAMRHAGDTEREAVARASADALNGKVCWLRIQVQKPVRALEVRHDGELIERAEWSRGIAADAGTYALQAKAPGKRTWSVELQVPTCPSVVTVRVPELENEGNAVATSSGEAAGGFISAAGARPLSSHDTTPQDAGVGDRQTKVLAYSLAGVGAAGLIVGGVFFERYGSANERAKRVCYQSFGCTRQEVQQHAELVEEARTNRARAAIGFSVGGVALAGAGVAWLMSEPEQDKVARTTVNVSFSGSGHPVFSIEGRF